MQRSSTRQVLENRESTDRQHSLRDHALGWPTGRIVTIGAGPGLSGWTVRLRQEISRSRVGAVPGLEVSRPPPNAAESFQLRDWCRVTDMPLIEGKLVFSPARHDYGLALRIPPHLWKLLARRYHPRDVLMAPRNHIRVNVEVEPQWAEHGDLGE